IAYLIGDTVTDNNNGNFDTKLNDNCSDKTRISDTLKLFPIISKTALNCDTSSNNNSNGTENNSNNDMIAKKASVMLKDYHPALRNVSMRLEGSTLWNKFHAYGTEMIVTKTGR
ncbi:unnamed protein product, partial [Acanthocheilonema viteae]